MIAITHDVSPRLSEGELTHIPRQTIDLERARSQHAVYEQALEELGSRVRRLNGSLHLPDSVFVEDTAVVLDELAIITRPGAESRRGEIPVVAEVLRDYRDLFEICPPGTLDGGDVLQIGKMIFVGISTRTNKSGVEQLARFVAPHAYELVRVGINKCLHLKSAVTYLGSNTLLINRMWVDEAYFQGWTLIDVDPNEAYAANALRVGEQILYAGSFPKTQVRLEAAGFNLSIVDLSELQKAEGAVTCCSLIFSP